MSDRRCALVLAAGASRRFGGAKLIAPLRGRPVIGWVVDAALAARVDRVVVVLGAQAQDVAMALKPWAGDRLIQVVASDWREGLTASLKAGVRALPGETEAFAVFLGDMPDVSSAEADALLDAVQAGAPAARLAHPLGPAHPIAFAADQAPALLRLSGDQGARSLLQSLGDRVVQIPSDNPGAVRDIDTREDLARLMPVQAPGSSTSTASPAATAAAPAGRRTSTSAAASTDTSEES